MRIIYVHSLMFNQLTWARVAKRLAGEGLDLVLIPQLKWEKAAEELASGRVDLLLAELSQGQEGFAQIMEQADRAAHRIGLGQDIPAGWSSLSAQDLALFRAYLARVSEENYLHGIRFAASACGADTDYQPPQEVQTEGIFHPAADKVFIDRKEYLRWLALDRGLDPGRPLIGLVCHYAQVAEGNTAEIEALILALEEHGFRPLCVFCESPSETGEPPDKRHSWFRNFLDSGEKPAALLNLLAARFLSQEDEIGLLKELDRPLIQLIRVHHQTPKEWLEDGYGLNAASLVYGLAQPEMAGAIEPTVFAARRPGNEALCYEPIPERIELLCRRLGRWLALARKPNQDKRVTVVLHNAPCQGVEATIGTGVGLNVFDSLARLLRAMDREGYDVGHPPADGAELKALILSRKAVSEFRWTTPDEIVTKGGVLHYTTREEYQAYQETLPEPVRAKVNEDWDQFPGEAMVYEREGEPTLLVTGIQLGKTKVMVQPKRGCYGAKCNGEVCRILHDPLISPPHHWLATYHYIDRTSDAVIHFGCEGALEYLPAKAGRALGAVLPGYNLKRAAQPLPLHHGRGGRGLDRQAAGPGRAGGPPGPGLSPRPPGWGGGPDGGPPGPVPAGQGHGRTGPGGRPGPGAAASAGQAGIFPGQGGGGGAGLRPGGGDPGPGRPGPGPGQTDPGPHRPALPGPGPGPGGDGDDAYLHPPPGIARAALPGGGGRSWNLTGRAVRPGPGR